MVFSPFGAKRDGRRATVSGTAAAVAQQQTQWAQGRQSRLSSVRQQQPPPQQQQQQQQQQYSALAQQQPWQQGTGSAGYGGGGSGAQVIASDPSAGSLIMGTTPLSRGLKAGATQGEACLEFGSTYP